MTSKPRSTVQETAPQPLAALVRPSGGLVRAIRRDVPARERKVIEESRLQKIVLDEQGTKGEFAHELMRALHHTGDVEFYELLTGATALREQTGLPADFQALFDGFLIVDMQQAAKHIQGTTEVTARSMAEVVAMSLYPAPEEPKSVLKRFFGG